MNILNAEQYAFFSLIADLAFLNPFSKDREQIERQLLIFNQNGKPIVNRQHGLMEMLDWRFQELAGYPGFDIRQYQGKTQEILRLAWLVRAFYRYQSDFEKHIDTQQETVGKNLELAFALTILGYFEQAGFNLEETAHYIALLFQLHRAYRFIDAAVPGSSTASTGLRERLWNNVFTFNPAWYLTHLYSRMEDFSLLLLGETGTGKSLSAKATGCSGYIPFDAKSGRFKESFTSTFQAINLSQYSTGVLESELFGHKKGAFTGAVDNHSGLFATCSKYGSVFIDEIGEIDISIQVKLLNVLQDRRFSPVGSREQHRFEGRVISATNRSIEQLMRSGQFRNDFYYRLCSDVITLPSLRERIGQNPGELRQLITSLLKRVLENPDGDLIESIEARIRQTVPEHYHWPGNIRELEQCIRRICITGGYLTQASSLSKQQEHAAFQPGSQGKYPTAQELLQNYCRFLYGKYGSYETVARMSALDRRTVKKYIGAGDDEV